MNIHGQFSLPFPSLLISNMHMCMCNSSKVSSREQAEEAMMHRCCLWVRRQPQQRLPMPLSCRAARRRPGRPWPHRRGPTRWRSARDWRGCRSRSRHSSARAATRPPPSSATTTTTPSPSPATSARRAAATGRAAAPSVTSPSEEAAAGTSARPSPPSARHPPPRSRPPRLGSCPAAHRPHRPPRAGSSLRDSAPSRTSTYRSWDRCTSRRAT
jgi:hypothetical protein